MFNPNNGRRPYFDLVVKPRQPTRHVLAHHQNVSEETKRAIIEAHYRRLLARRIRRVARVAVVASKNNLSVRQLRARLLKRKARHSLHVIHLNQYRIISAGFVLLFAISTLLTPLIEANREKTLSLDAQTKALIGDTRDDSKDYLKFDSNKKTYTFEAPAQDTASVHNHTGRNADSYTATLPDSPKDGIVVTDTKSNIPVSLVPDFFTTSIKKSDGDHLVYQSGSRKIIYTLKYNGLKEDIIIPKFQGPQMTYDFQLRLPSGVEARVDNEGNIGIYSADLSLYGNISFGSDADRAKVDKAREKSEKTNLVMTIPYPVIRDASGAEYSDRTQFELGQKKVITSKQKDAKLPEDTDLTIVTTNTYPLRISATKLQDLAYPLSIDPTMQVTNSADFSKLNYEGNITLDTTNNLIKRTATTGANLNTWSSTGTGLTPRYGAATVIYNGFIYVSGGCLTNQAITNNCTAVTNSVQKAPITTSGIGSWTTETGLPDNAWQHTMLAYNGYLYVISGGYNTAPNGNPYIYSIKIKSNGSLPAAWTTTTVLCCQLYSTSFVYNGYMYRLGGSAAGALTALVYYSKINGDGSFGTWSTTTSMPTAIFEAATSVYNGRVYVLGGCTNTNPCNTFTNAVISAQIFADGTLSAWTTRSSFATARRSPMSWTSGGYIYMGAGQTSTSSLGDVQYAPINSDGSLGTWSTTTSLGTVRDHASSVVSNEQLYIIGGENGGTILGTSEFSTVKGAGEASAWTTQTNTFPTNRSNPAVVAYQGYIYISGGCSPCGSGGTYLADIWFAKINDDGTVGPTWNSGPNFTTGRSQHGMVAFNGNIYITGGLNSASILPLYQSDIQILDVDTFDGHMGTWKTALQSFSNGRTAHATVFYNDYMYIIGGRNGGTIYNDVQLAQVTNTGTFTGGFNNTTALPVGMLRMSAVVAKGRMYIAGGCTALDGSFNCTSALSAVRYATVNSNGSLGSWTNNPTGLGSASYDYGGLVFFNNNIYITGGQSPGFNDIRYAPVNDDGTLGAFIASSTITKRADWGVTSYNGVVYALGGGETRTLSYTRLQNGGSGKAIQWKATTSLPSARGGVGVVAYNGYLYCMGGTTSGLSSPTNLTEYATINQDGTLGSWQTGNSTNLTARYAFSTALVGNKLYTIGGKLDQATTVNTIEFATINSDGTLTNWQSTTGFNGIRANAITGSWNNYIYMAVGDGTGQNVQYAYIESDGTINAWTVAATPPDYAGAPGGGIYNGYIYVVAGNNSGGNSADVYAAPLNSNGSVGTWIYTTNTPVDISEHNVVIANGFIYLTTGWDGALQNFMQNTFVAPILANGHIGQWSVGAKIIGTSNNTKAGAAYYNGYIYRVGGCLDGNCPSLSNDSIYTAVEAIPKKGYISKQYDLDAGVKPTFLITRGTKRSGAVTAFNYASSDNLQTTMDNDQGVADTEYGGSNRQALSLGTSRTLSRYIYLRYTIDDTFSARFPDTSNESTITDFDMYYIADPGNRLRGGRAFTNGADRGLDAQPQ